MEPRLNATVYLSHAQEITLRALHGFLFFIKPELT